MTEQVAIAIELPTDAAALLAGAAAEIGKGAIDIKPPAAAEAGAGSLSFDPISGTAIGWFVLKIVGETAIALTGAILAELIHKRLQERQELARKTVRIRFPDGEVYSLQVNDPESMARLQEQIARKATKR